MATATAVKTARTIIAAGTSNAAGASTRGAIDLRTALGGVLTVKLTNGATGPTLQAVVNVHIAHDAGTLPATGAAGATWKTYASLGGGGTANSAVTEMPLEIPQGIMHMQVEVTGNTTQAVTGEAFFSELTSINS